MFLEQFYTEKKYNEGVGAKTLYTYRYYFSLLPLAGMNPDNPADLTVRNFRTLLASEGSRRQWKPVTYNTARKCYRSYCAHLLRDRIIDFNPFDQIPKMKEPQKLPKSLSVEQVKTLKYALLSVFKPDTFNGFRDFSIFQTLLYTGIRRKELLDLEPADLDLYERNLSIRNGKGGKGRNVPICDQLLPILLDYSKALREQHPEATRLFPSKNDYALGERNLRSIFDKVKAKLSFPLSPHRLRHTFATELVRNDLDIFNIASVLGHSSVKTTQIYLTANTESINRKISSLRLYS